MRKVYWKTEVAQHDQTNESAHFERKNVFDEMMNALRTVPGKKQIAQ